MKRYTLLSYNVENKYAARVGISVTAKADIGLLNEGAFMEAVALVNENIFRICTEYKGIFTTIYIIKTDEGVMIFDTASYECDIEEVLVPFLREKGIAASDVKGIFISHKHRDHAGGLPYLVKHYPDAVIYSASPVVAEEYAQYQVVYPEEGRTILSVLVPVAIPGHTADSCALLDTRTKTLITGDCFQVYGIFGQGDWACNITFIPEHLSAIEKVRGMDIEEIYTAHDYHPIGYCFIGKDCISKALDGCVEPLLNIKKMILTNPEMSDEEIRELYNKNGSLPTVSLGVVRAVRNAAAEGKI